MFVLFPCTYGRLILLDLLACVRECAEFGETPDPCRKYGLSLLQWTMYDLVRNANASASVSAVAKTSNSSAAECAANVSEGGAGDRAQTVGEGPAGDAANVGVDGEGPRANSSDSGGGRDGQSGAESAQIVLASNLADAFTALLDFAVDGGAAVKAIVRGGPADIAGVCAWDVVQAVDGVDVKGAGMSEVLALISGAGSRDAATKTPGVSSASAADGKGDEGGGGSGGGTLWLSVARDVNVADRAVRLGLGRAEATAPCDQGDDGGSDESAGIAQAGAAGGAYGATTAVVGALTWPVRKVVGVPTSMVDWLDSTVGPSFRTPISCARCCLCAPARLRCCCAGGAKAPLHAQHSANGRSPRCGAFHCTRHRRCTKRMPSSLHGIRCSPLSSLGWRRHHQMRRVSGYGKFAAGHASDGDDDDDGAAPQPFGLNYVPPSVVSSVTIELPRAHKTGLTACYWNTNDLSMSFGGDTYLQLFEFARSAGGGVPLRRVANKSLGSEVSGVVLGAWRWGDAEGFSRLLQCARAALRRA